VTAGLGPRTTTRLSEAVDRVRVLLDRSLARLADLDLMAPSHPIGGKLLRPRLLLVFALKNDEECMPLDRVAALAAAVELIHLASLHHDDVIDASPHRRQAASARELFGNKVSILFGDAILTAALDLLLRVSSRRMQRAVAHAVRETLRGEIAQHTGHRSPAISDRECVRVAALKTGSLFGLAAQLGALASGDPPEVSAVAYRIGRRLGTAYQLVDDAMDYLGTAEQLGKEPGSDYRQGIATLPLVRAWRAASPFERQMLEEGFAGNGNANFASVRRTIVESPTLSSNAATAREQLRSARELLPLLTQTDQADRIAAYCDEIEGRIELSQQECPARPS